MTEDEISNRYLRLARQFENLAETYREVRLYGPANDAEAWKCISLILAECTRCAPLDREEKRAA